VAVAACATLSHNRVMVQALCICLWRAVQRFWRPWALLVLWVGLSPVHAQPSTLHVVSDENYPPYLFKDAKGQNAGYLADLWALWSRQTGIPVTLTATQWSRAQAMVLNGEADVIDMIYRTPAREPLYAFSRPYAELPVAIFTHRSISGITDVAGLRGFTLGVQDGDACIEMLEREGITALKRYPNYVALIDAAVLEEVKLFCLDQYPADFYLYQRGQHREYLKAFELYRGEFHWAVRKGQEEVLAIVQQGMDAIPASDKAALAKRWLQPPTDWSVWWQPVGWTAAALLALAALLLLWVGALRKQVRRRTQELREERATLRAIFNAVPDLLWLKDPQGRYLACNKRFELLYGAPEAQIVGKTDYDFVDTAHADAFRHHDHQAMKEGHALGNDEELTFASDGHQERVQTIKTPVQDSSGQLIGVLGIARDMTDMLVSQERLKYALERLQAAENIANIGSWEWKLTSDTVTWSPQHYVIFDQDPAHFQPSMNAMLALVHPEDRPRVRLAVERARSTTDLKTLHMRLLLPGQRIRYLQVFAHAVQGPDGRVEKPGWRHPGHHRQRTADRRAGGLPQPAGAAGQ